MAAGERLGFTPTGMTERARSLLAKFDLPVGADRAAVEAAWPYVMSDNKRTLAAVKLPVVTGIGEGRVERVGIEALRAGILEPL